MTEILIDLYCIWCREQFRRFDHGVNWRSGKQHVTYGCSCGICFAEDIEPREPQTFDEIRRWVERGSQFYPLTVEEWRRQLTANWEISNK